MEWRNLIKQHYEDNWNGKAVSLNWTSGPFEKLYKDFSILEFKPTQKHNMWTYATCGMSQLEDEPKIELHLFSPEECDDLIELLTIVAHYHRTGHKLGMGHTVNFGRPWYSNSKCNYGLLSIPYLDGPQLEWLHISNTSAVRFLWLVPVTKEEVEFKKRNGLEALENEFEKKTLDYVNPLRESVV